MSVFIGSSSPVALSVPSVSPCCFLDVSIAMALNDYLAELEPWPATRRPHSMLPQDAAALEAARIEFLGAKSGRLKAVQKGLGSVDKADRPAAGKRFNEVKQSIERLTRQPPRRLAGRVRPAAAARQFDPTVPGSPSPAGPPASDHADDRRDERDHGPAGVQRGRGPGSGRPLAQFRGPEHPAGASRPRSAGKFLSGNRGRRSGIRGRRQGSGVRSGIRGRAGIRDKDRKPEPPPSPSPLAPHP